MGRKLAKTTTEKEIKKNKNRSEFQTKNPMDFDIDLDEIDFDVTPYEYTQPHVPYANESNSHATNTFPVLSPPCTANTDNQVDTVTRHRILPVIYPVLSIKAKHAIMLHDEAALDDTLRCFCAESGTSIEESERVYQIFFHLKQHLDILQVCERDLMASFSPDDTASIMKCIVDVTRHRIKSKRYALDVLLGDTNTETFGKRTLELTEDCSDEIPLQREWCTQQAKRVRR